MLVCKFQNVFELVVRADACVCGVHFEQVLDLAARSSRLATRFPRSPGCARCARRGERCHLRALQPITRHSPRPRQAPDPLPRHRLPEEEAFVSRAQARSHITYRPPQGAQRCIDKRRARKMQLDARNTSTRGVTV